MRQMMEKCKGPKAFNIQELMRYTWNLDLSSQNQHLQNQVIKTSFAAKKNQKTEITKNRHKTLTSLTYQYHAISGPPGNTRKAKMCQQK